MSWKRFENFIVEITERVLTARKRYQLKKKSKIRYLPLLVDWILSFFVIILLVILINMFVFQNYKIPSGSMIPELLEGDLVLVEKMSFGPEVLPGKLKLPASRLPQRGEVVSFESELYALQGPWVELFHRFIYFITLSTVNLRTDENKVIIKDLLIKRVIGLPGDCVREINNRFEIKPACEEEWLPEDLLLLEKNIDYRINDYSYKRDLPYYRQPLANFILTLQSELDSKKYFLDIFTNDPGDPANLDRQARLELGYYVPEGFFFPLGDNRPNSNDARYFGPVPLERIQGKALLRFFPFNRVGLIE